MADLDRTEASTTGTELSRAFVNLTPSLLSEVLALWRFPVKRQ